MQTDKLQSRLMELLDPGIYKTTAQLVEEFRMEYPSLWEELVREGQALFGKSCSSIQQPSIRIAQALLGLPSESCRSYSKGNQHFWSKKEGSNSCLL